jgi:hypothetical protein
MLHHQLSLDATPAKESQLKCPRAVPPTAAGVLPTAKGRLRSRPTSDGVAATGVWKLRHH